VSAETSMPASSGDPGVGVQTPPEGIGNAFDSLAIPYVSNPFGNPISGEVSITTPPDGIGLSRKVKRVTETQEIQIRGTHRRRKLLTRSGVLAGFGLAMVVYPVMGNVVTYENSAENVPGVILGQAPTTGHALLGNGPALISSELPLPSIDDQAHMLATSIQYSPSAALPGCQPQSAYPAENGQLPADQLCTLWDGNQLRADAALAFAELNAQFKVAFGRDICLQEGYRSYDDQVAIKRKRGYLAATPGKSVHGWGLAFDLCDGDDGGAPKQWLDANAATYGYENPDWAKWRKHEPWHWEYTPGTQSLGVYGAEYWEADGGTSTVDPGTTEPVAPAVEVSPTPEPAAGDTGLFGQ